MNLFKTLISSIFNKFGYTIIPNWKHEHYAQSEFLRKLFLYLEIDCVFDVGANKGQFGEFLRKQCGYEGLIISFEPIPSCLIRLNTLANADGNWLVEPYALGRQAGHTKFKIMADSQFSSFLNPDYCHIDRFSAMNKFVEEIDIEVRTLKEVIPLITSRNKVNALYLKLDTQGFDLEVAAGAGISIGCFRALQTEASIVPIYEESPSFVESISAFRDMGFDVSGIFPNNPEHFPQMIEFDCHMINRKHLIPANTTEKQG